MVSLYMSWDQRIPNEGLFTRQMSSYFPSGNNYVNRSMNTRQHDIQKPKKMISGSVPVRNIGLESHLYSLGYYNPKDCMTEEDYKTYLKGRIASNMRFDETSIKGHGSFTIKDMKWNIITFMR